MLTRDDLIDLLVGYLAGERRSPARRAAGGSSAPSLPEARGRRFLSEYEIKRLLTAGGQALTIPKDAILSPLALDWLALKRVKIVRE